MFTLKIDPATNDLVFDGQNNLVMVEGEDEIVQSIRLLLGTNTGEWFLNPQHGLVYEHLQVKVPDMERIRAEVMLALDQEPRISEVEDLQIDFDRQSRMLTICFRTTTQNGDVIEGEEALEI